MQWSGSCAPVIGLGSHECVRTRQVPDSDTASVQLDNRCCHPKTLTDSYSTGRKEAQ